MVLSHYSKSRRQEIRDEAILSVTQGTPHLEWGMCHLQPLSSVSETCQALPGCQLLARERANWELCKHFCSFSLVLKPVYVSLSFSSKVNTRYQAVLVIQLFGLYTEIFSHSCRADFLHAKHKKLLFLKSSLFPLYSKKKDSWLFTQSSVTLKERTTLRRYPKWGSFDTEAQHAFASWFYKKIPPLDQSLDAHTLVNTKPGIKRGKSFLLNRILYRSRKCQT